MRIALFQMNVKWKQVEDNLLALHDWLQSHSTEADVVVVPEMFATGFCVEAVEQLAGTFDVILRQVKEWSRQYDIAITGSTMCKENDKCYNRSFFVTPEGFSYFYDKHHLFRMGAEGTYFEEGKRRVIVNYKDWNILLQVCYDLRFPVYSRNQGNEYDLALYVACWPMSRIEAWRILLPARAIENVAYVIGVNATGFDSDGKPQGGHSMAVDMKGNKLCELNLPQESYSIVEIEKESLQKFRSKFPVWKDADSFTLKK